MSSSSPKETVIDKSVTYTIELDGRLIVIEHVPARIDLQTGEQLFSPQTVERIQYHRLGAGVDRGRGLVEDQDRGIP